MNHIFLTVLLKTSSGVQTSASFRFSIDEMKRLRKDWEEYIKDSTPRGGVYDCEVAGAGLANAFTKKTLFLRFDDVLAIF